MSFCVAVDGPAGSGKSTIAKIVAKDKGLIYVDTGAMYRAMGIFMIRKGIAAEDTASVVAALPEADITIVYENGVQQVILNGENVTPYLRTEETGNMASKVSAIPEVRAKLTQLQQKMGETTSIIMDGRDIGTVVLPNADVKFFLTASSRCRAERRYKELLEKGTLGESTLESIQADIEERDYRDSHREAAPLKQADDAILIDTSEMTIEEVVAAIEEKIG